MGEKTKRVARENIENQKTIVSINEYVRFIDHGDNEFELQKKNEYTDGSESWIFKGWIYNEESLMKNARSLIRDKKLKTKKTAEVDFFLECFREADREIKEFFKV